MRKIAVVTGSRAEYGLLYLLLKEIAADPDLTLQLIITAMHLSPEFGLTYKLIEQDGFKIDAKVEMLLSTDTASGVAKSVGLGVLGFTDAFEALKPDLIVVLGDRFEILAAAQAALFLKIPIAHIHGGELSMGALDDSIRHAISKMSHIHFVCAEPYRNRVIQMGEQPTTVFNVGAPGIERIKKIKLLSQMDLEKILDFKFSKPTFLITYHPETLLLENIENNLKNLFSALDFFPNAKVIITKSNADEAGRLINKYIDDYESKNSDRVKVFLSMGDLNYLSSLNCVDVVIGNSSSGIIEAPSFKIPTVNIGNRQAGRIRTNSIIDCAPDLLSIRAAIQKALSPEFKFIVNQVISPYDQGETSKKIKDIIRKIDLKEVIRKKFYDYNIQNEALV